MMHHMWTRGRLYDVAPGPTLLVLIGVPAVIVAVVAGLAVLAALLIRRAIRGKRGAGEGKAAR